MLSKSQQEALKKMNNGENLFITGIAGSGKSFLIDLFRDEYKEYKDKKIAVTSTTGISSLLIKGTTIHSYLGIGLGNDDVEKLYTKILKKRFLKKRWENLDILIIDEVSMLKPELLDKLEKIARMIRRRGDVFGGIQVILTGDLLQLPPIGSSKFCFESECWSRLIGNNVIYLEENFRQLDNDDGFVECLNELRMGYISDKNEKLLNTRNKLLENDTGIIPTKIFSLNYEVDEINRVELDKLEGEYYQYQMEVFSKEKSFVVDKIINNCNMIEGLCLCKGAQVMLLTNLDIKLGLVNGSRGVITRFVDDIPMVKFLNNEEMLIDYHTLVVEDNDKVLCEISQIPLRVSYAVSVHKIQGQTLDCCEVDLKNIFDYGQTYVALSRVRNLSGLYLKNFDKSKIKAHPKAIKFYNNIS